MEKATWTLGITIVVLILLGVVITGKPSLVAPATPVKKAVTTPATTKEAPAKEATQPAGTQQPATATK